MVGGDRGERIAGAYPEARPWRFLLTNDPQQFIDRGGAETLAVEGSFAGQQLVEQHPKGVNLAPGVDIELIELGLLGAHVVRRPDHLAKLGEDRPLRELPLDRLVRWR